MEFPPKIIPFILHIMVGLLAWVYEFKILNPKKTGLFLRLERLGGGGP